LFFDVRYFDIAGVFSDCMSLIRREVSLLRKEGLMFFSKRVYGYLRRKIRLYQGMMTLSMNNTSVRLVANDEYVTSKTQSRFQEEEYELMNILEEVKNDDVFYDIGANTGLYSCFVANKCDRCQVVAFEPYPPNITELNNNAELNNPEWISIRNVALSDTFGTVCFSTPDEPTPGHGAGSITDDQSGESVRTVRGDKLISENEAPSPNIVKIDVEGAEPLVVDGLKNALSDRRCRLVFCELHPSALSEYGSNTSKMVTKFEKMGYDVELHDRWGSSNVIEARRE
jgi:methyltransferase, FkbM family